MELWSEAVREYVEALLPTSDRILRRLEAEASEEGIPIVGPHVGALLTVLTSARGARRALELGTAIGYSTIWIARGLQAGGRLVTVEAREDMVDRARGNLKEAGLEAVVEVVHGDALDVLPGLGGGYDLIFNDVDKLAYPKLLPLCKEALQPGGVLVTDNVLWSGRVANPEDSSASTEAIREYNHLLAAAREMTTVILPVRDGISISVKRV
jgi:predicted O-methyltransferase YrrM